MQAHDAQTLIQLMGPHRESTLAEAVRSWTDDVLYLRAPLDLVGVTALQVGDQIVAIEEQSGVSRQVHLRHQWLSPYPAGAPVLCLGPGRGARSAAW